MTASCFRGLQYEQQQIRYGTSAQAAEAEQINAERVRGVVTLLYRCRHNARMRFEPTA